MNGAANQQPTVLVIAGPTASGKTALGVRFAKHLNAEVVSADSRQLFRYMDVGTAKPTPEERGAIPHHGFDIVHPDDNYSAGRFAREARAWIAEIHGRGKRVVVVGGSGLYLKALVDGFFSGDDIKDSALHEELEARSETEGLESLYLELKRLDPIYAEKIVPGDHQRILRALEVCLASGEPFSELHNRERDPAAFPTLWIAPDWPREELYRRIDSRVDEMFDRGLVREVRDLLDRGYRETNALKSVGYVEVVDFLEGRLPSLEETRARIKQNTRHFAKRQLTWFRAEPRIEWFAPNDPDSENALLARL